MVCQNHNDKEVEFYCEKDKTLTCSLCVWNHSDHRQWVKVFTKTEIKEYNKELLSHLNNFKNIIEEKQMVLNSIQEEETTITSEDLGKCYLDIIEILRTPFIRREKDLVKPGIFTPRNNELDDPDFLIESLIARTDVDKTFLC